MCVIALGQMENMPMDCQERFLAGLLNHSP